eukprot:512590-Pyramimonas_sp.AAC.2
MMYYVYRLAGAVFDPTGWGLGGAAWQGPKRVAGGAGEPTDGCHLAAPGVVERGAEAATGEGGAAGSCPAGQLGSGATLRERYRYHLTGKV